MNQKSIVPIAILLMLLGLAAVGYSNWAFNQTYNPDPATAPEAFYHPYHTIFVPLMKNAGNDPQSVARGMGIAISTLFYGGILPAVAGGATLFVSKLKRAK
ncbi:MAG: hypothetical protein QNK37_23340 [Acidobacteriota bacterium]|nr:hypothetical protein [Acidobacteriota bacterium]